MPKGEGGEVEVVFFPVPESLSDDQLEKECASRNLRPADPYSLAAVNAQNRTFADEHQNFTHWKDSLGKWCFMMFCGRYPRDSRVYVTHSSETYGAYKWFAGIRNSSILLR